MGRLDGKVALITGAGSGLGQASAVLFAEEGAKVAVVDIVPAGGQETVRMVKEAQGDAIFIEADVSKAAEVEKMTKMTVDKYGRIDILYNIAAVVGSGFVPMLETTEEDWDLINSVNLKSVFLSSKCAIPVMLNQGGGVILNTASNSALYPTWGLSAYCASKAGVILLTKTMALEYGEHNIRVNCLCPGGMLTPLAEKEMPSDPEIRQQMLKRWLMPRQVAQAALLLVSDDAGGVNGAVLVADGGGTAGIVIPQWGKAKAGK